MRLQEINPGQKKQLPNASSSDVFNKLIKPNCGDILRILRGSGALLYRGIKINPTNGIIFRGKSWEDRRPMDSQSKVTNKFNDMLKACGMTATRSNSIFVSSSKNKSTTYGEPYIIFPIDGFEYTTTTKHDIILRSWLDLLSEEEVERIGTIYQMYYSRAASDSEIRTRFSSFLSSMIYRQADRSDAEEGIALLKRLIPDVNYIQELDTKNLITLDNFKERYQPSNSDMSSYLGEAHEILICGQYYALRESHYSTESMLEMVNKL